MHETTTKRPGRPARALLAAVIPRRRTVTLALFQAELRTLDAIGGGWMAPTCSP